jgi:guanylate kinase
MKNIWISGSINSGKSTVAKILGKDLKMAVIELDTLSTFVENFLSFEVYLKLNYEIVSEIVDIYNKRGYGAIVVYPLGEEKYLELKKNLDNFQIFILDPTLQVALSERGERKLSEQEKERIKYHYSKNIHKPSFGIRLETKNSTPFETADAIKKFLIN